MKVHMSATFNRVSRLVVLPDYQGISLGKKLLNFMADYYTRKTGLSFRIITSNPQLLRSHLGGWVITARGHGKHVDSRGLRHSYTGDAGERLTVSLMYKQQVNSAEKRNSGI
jgi:GNAT superfamily N-acetyltransferase